MKEWQACGRGICAANEGHAGTCAEASGWADDALFDAPPPGCTDDPPF